MNKHTWYQNKWQPGTRRLSCSKHRRYCYDVTWNGVFSWPAALLCDVTLSLHTSEAKSTWLMIIRTVPLCSYLIQNWQSVAQRVAPMCFRRLLEYAHLTEYVQIHGENLLIIQMIFPYFAVSTPYDKIICPSTHLSTNQQNVMLKVYNMSMSDR